MEIIRRKSGSTTYTECPLSNICPKVNTMCRSKAFDSEDGNTYNGHGELIHNTNAYFNYIERRWKTCQHVDLAMGY